MWKAKNTMSNVRILNDQLYFGEGVSISFQRTLRIPDDGKTYPLPPGLGRFPIRLIDDYAERVPAAWREKGGVLLPMYQREAMWLSFSCPSHKPRALKVGIGKVCAISGRRWSNKLRGPNQKRGKKQDYVVVPTQPWLDGIAAGKDSIRQFVAMPLGMGYTVEGQITGKEDEGGVQLQVYEPRPGIFPEVALELSARASSFGSLGSLNVTLSCAAPMAGQAMGLAAGGRMKQKIYADPHGIDTWDRHNNTRVFIHLCNSQMWREITGEVPPSTPVTAREYQRHGLPWFDLYDEGADSVKASKKLKKVKSIKQLDKEKFGTPMQDDSPVGVSIIKKMWSAAKGVVRDGQW